MDYKDIQRLVKLINREQLAEFKMRDGDFEISIRTINYSKAAKTQIISSTKPAEAFSNSTQAEASPEPIDTNNQTAQNEEVSDDLIAIKSPIVGTFYRATSPDKPPYVKVGDHIKEGDVVCIVEAMKLFNEIEAEVSGKIVKVMIEDAQPVQYDQVLFMVDPNS